MSDQVIQSIIVKGKVEAIYDFWSDVENYPKFMTDIQYVEDLGGHKSYWSSKEGPNGIVLTGVAPEATSRRAGR
jgi:uncharacterized membrane protein